MPGTFLYIPHGWLHRVTATSPTVHFAMFAPLENEKVFDESIAQMVDHVRIVRESITEQAKENALSLFAVFLHQLLVNIVRQTIRTSPEVICSDPVLSPPCDVLSPLVSSTSL